MKNVKVIKCKSKNMLCNCNVLPCPHFTIADHAIFLPQSKHIKEIVRDRFNFATFVSRLCRNATNGIVKHVLKVLKYKQTLRKNVSFRVDLNQCDPSNGKTALHYACMFHDWATVVRLINRPDVDVNRLDHDGLPARAYYYTDIPGLSDQNRLRCLIAHQSKKLFDYLFRNVVPETWNSNVFETLTLEAMQLMNVSQRQRVVRDIRDSKGNTLLHEAAKRGRKDTIRFVLSNVDRDAQWITNSKGKLPISYCKTLHCFDLFVSTGRFYRKTYFDVDRNHMPSNIALFYKLFPEIVERHYETRNDDGAPTLGNDRYTKETDPIITSSYLEVLNMFKPYLHPTLFRDISKSVRDPANNSLWHFSNDFQFLHPCGMNDRNISGNTPLHTNPNKKALLELGAHPDLLNRLELVPELDKEKTVCSLKCLAARKIKTGNIPYFLKDFVEMHHPKYEEKIELRFND